MKRDSVKELNDQIINIYVPLKDVIISFFSNLKRVIGLTAITVLDIFAIWVLLFFAITSIPVYIMRRLYIEYKFRNELESMETLFEENIN